MYTMDIYLLDGATGQVTFITLMLYHLSQEAHDLKQAWFQICLKNTSLHPNAVCSL